MKKIIVLLSVIVCVIGLSGCQKEGVAITEWKNKDKDLTTKEFDELTKNNNHILFKNGKVQVKKEDGVSVTQEGGKKSYYIENTYLPKNETDEIIKQAKTNKKELLGKYIGAAELIITDKEGNVEKVIFSTAPKDYGQLIISFDKEKVTKVDKL